MNKWRSWRRPKNRKEQINFTLKKHRNAVNRAYDHDQRSEKFPAKVPELGQFVAGHLLDCVAESVGSEDPTDGHGLPKDDPHEWQSGCRIKVHQLEEINAAFGAHRQAQSEHEDAHADSELPPVLEQGSWPVVHDAGDESLNVAELGVDAEHQQHDEEYDGPNDRAGKFEHQVGIREEDEAGSGVDHFVDGSFLDVSHVAQNGEDEHAGDEAGHGVDHAGDDGVFVAIVVELVVGPQGR